MVRSSRFKIQGSRFEVQGTRFNFQDSVFEVQKFEVQNPTIKSQGLEKQDDPTLVFILIACTLYKINDQLGKPEQNPLNKTNETTFTSKTS